MSVFVLDKRKKLLMPCSEKRARKLLDACRAVVIRLVPFTIRLKDRVGGDLQPVQIKLDPGSKTTGIALVRVQDETDPESGASRRTVHPLWLGHLQHRGSVIRDALQARSAMRRRRRSQNLRHRAPRFDNRTKPEGWLAPSLRHRLETTLSWVGRLRRWSPVSALAVERVKFDMQSMQNPEISGVAYQQGTLHGYTVREYLLEKFKRQCVYCDKTDLPLQVEHVKPRALGGSDRVSNLALACQPCNQKKDALPVEVFLAKQAERLAKLKKQLKTPLHDAAAVNSTRNALVSALKNTGLPLETADGGRTKFNRHTLDVPKTHALDAACVGRVDAIGYWQRPVLNIKATGRGSYQRTRLDASGFPRGYLTRSKRHFGFQTGDRIKAVVTTGKKAGTYCGRVAVRATGNFNIQIPGQPAIQGIHHRFCTLIQRADGYGYSFESKTA
ncbi:RNA-guided endonuclease IscB [Craterilacuibacter sp.]|uniref:RNA-guided endonuclease IscB n=1 Tax=Craterilacuibacter sp. TaxID=2870909 RepID=UPI003F3B6783